MKIQIPPFHIGLVNTDVKSQSMPIFESGQALPSRVPTVDSLVFDGPSFVNSNQPNKVKPLIHIPMTLSDTDDAILM